jgi:hypothetical protein
VQSMNLLLHGNTQENLILPEENATEFDLLLNGLQTEYQPETRQQHIFIEQLAISHWILWRRQRTLNTHETGLYAFGHNPGNWLDQDYRRLAIVERCKVSAERSLKQAFQNAESFRTDRKSLQNHLERHEKWRAEQEIRERRLKLQEQKQAAAAGSAASRAAAKARNTVPEKPPINWPPDGQPIGRKPIPKDPSANPGQPTQS